MNVSPPLKNLGPPPPPPCLNDLPQATVLPRNSPINWRWNLPGNTETRWCHLDVPRQSFVNGSAAARRRTRIEGYVRQESKRFEVHRHPPVKGFAWIWGTRKKTARFFLCVGGKSPPERLFRLWAQYAATPSLYDQTQDLPGFLACGWGDNAPQQKN